MRSKISDNEDTGTRGGTDNPQRGHENSKSKIFAKIRWLLAAEYTTRRRRN